MTTLCTVISCRFATGDEPFSRETETTVFDTDVSQLDKEIWNESGQNQQLMIPKQWSPECDRATRYTWCFIIRDYSSHPPCLCSQHLSRLYLLELTVAWCCCNCPVMWRCGSVQDSQRRTRMCYCFNYDGGQTTENYFVFALLVLVSEGERELQNSSPFTNTCRFGWKIWHPCRY